MYFLEGFEWYVFNFFLNRRSLRDKSFEYMSLEKIFLKFFIFINVNIYYVYLL